MESKSEQIYKEFERLTNKYFKRGNFCFNLNENEYIDKTRFLIVMEPLIDNEKVYKAKLPLILLGLQFKKIILKPISPIHSSEFESLFGFKCKCSNYNQEKQIVICAKNKQYDMNIIKDAIEEKINSDNFVEELCLLMLYGGYINNKIAISEMKTFIDSLKMI